METAGHGYSLERLAHLHGIVETVLFELGSALKSSGGKPASLLVFAFRW